MFPADQATSHYLSQWWSVYWRIYASLGLNIRYVVRKGIQHSLRWRHNERDSVSKRQPHDCLLNRLFRRRSKKTSKIRVTGLCEGNSPGTGEFPAQMASYAETVSIWWRHHVICWCKHFHQLHEAPKHCSSVEVLVYSCFNLKVTIAVDQSWKLTNWVIVEQFNNHVILCEMWNTCHVMLQENIVQSKSKKIKLIVQIALVPLVTVTGTTTQYFIYHKNKARNSANNTLCISVTTRTSNGLTWPGTMLTFWRSIGLSEQAVQKSKS